MNQLMILLQMMTVAGIPSFSSFTDIILPDSGAVQKREVPGPSMDYDDYEDEEEDYDDYDDYDYDSDDFETKKSGRLRQQIKSCEFIDLTALGPICNTGYKIKYYKVFSHRSHNITYLPSQIQRIMRLCHCQNPNSTTTQLNLT